MLRWPEPQAAVEALRRWAEEVGGERPELLRVGYFGSCARADWGVGSDLDVVIVVEQCAETFPRRAASWDLTGLPVAGDVLVYTRQEWAKIESARRQPTPLQWVWSRETPAG